MGCPHPGRYCPAGCGRETRCRTSVLDLMHEVGGRFGGAGCGAGRRACGRTRWRGSRTRPSTCGGCGRSPSSCTRRSGSGSVKPSRGDALGCGRITEHDLDVQAASEVAAATGLCPVRGRAGRGRRPGAVHRADRDAGGVGGRPDRRPAGADAGRAHHRPDRPAGPQGRGGGAGRPARAAAGRHRPGRAVGRADAAGVRAPGQHRGGDVRTDVEEHVRRDVRERTGIRTGRTRRTRPCPR